MKPKPKPKTGRVTKFTHFGWVEFGTRVFKEAWETGLGQADAREHTLQRMRAEGCEHPDKHFTYGTLSDILGRLY